MEDRDDDEEEGEGSEADTSHCGPRTPKRMRLIAPEVLPLGLERSDFHALRSTDNNAPTSNSMQGYSQENDIDELGIENWSTEEDRMLVELVLEKLKLSKSDWQDCARSLGKDRGTVGRRWKSLMGAGEVGIKNRKGRTRIHGSWR